VSERLRKKVPDNCEYSIINAGIDLKRFEYRNSNSEYFERNNIRFGFIGRLDKQKGIYNLLDAFIRLSSFYSNIFLEIAGKGKEEKKIKSKIPENLLSRINFRGNIEDINSFYKSIDVLIICSESEGGPLVLLEAMATGVLVITNEVGIVPEIIQNNLNGRLLMDNSPEEICRVMKQTIEESKKNNFIIKNARESVSSYTALKMIDKFNILSEKLISQT